MRTIAATTALLVAIGLPTLAMASEPAASFATRWPETAMREPTLAELVRLVAGVVREEVKPALEAELATGQSPSWRCTAEFCQLINAR